MAVDLKKIASKVVKLIEDDPSLITKFTKDPLSTVKKLVTESLTSDQLSTVVETVASKLTSGSGAASLLKGLLK